MSRIHPGEDNTARIPLRETSIEAIQETRNVDRAPGPIGVVGDGDIEVSSTVRNCGVAFTSSELPERLND